MELEVSSSVRPLMRQSGPSGKGNGEAMRGSRLLTPGGHFPVTPSKESGAIVVDASKPEAEWIAMMFGRMQAQAYLESLRKNTARALAVKKARNERVGSIPYGFQLHADAIHLQPDPAEFPVLMRILELRQSGLGGRRIAAALTAASLHPRTNKNWNHGNLQVLADR